MMTSNDSVWTPLDVFTWVAFGERRGGPEFLFPRAEWSRDWIHWPPQNLVQAFEEISTGLPWQPALGSFEAVGADSDRAWAREIMKRTGEGARELAEALTADIQRHRHNLARYQSAKADVMAAVCNRRLQVWARKAHGPASPDYEAEPELLSHRLFTHQPREVNEAGWIDAPGDYKGPWWDEVRFDVDQVLALWPADLRSDDASPPTGPQPFPDRKWITPWVAVSWRAFGVFDAPTHITRNRSFDGGESRLHDESESRYASRQDEHSRFDAAERELLDLLAVSGAKAKGQPPARARAGELLHHPAPIHKDIIADTFLNRQLAFEPGGELIHRVGMLGSLFPSHELHDSDADPRFPLYHDVLIEAAGLREAWDTKVKAANQPAEILAWVSDAAETFLRERNAKPKRDSIVRACVAALGCRYEDAEAAHGELPDRLRRRRGERARTVKSAD